MAQCHWDTRCRAMPRWHIKPDWILCRFHRYILRLMLEADIGKRRT